MKNRLLSGLTKSKYGELEKLGQLSSYCESELLERQHKSRVQWLFSASDFQY